MGKNRRRRAAKKPHLGLAGSAVFCSAFLGCGDVVCDPPPPPLCDELNQFPPVSFDFSTQPVPSDLAAQVIGSVSHALVRRIDSLAVSTTLGLVSSVSVLSNSAFSFEWKPVDPSVGVTEGHGDISILISVTTTEPPPDSTCQFAQTLRVQVDSKGTGQLIQDALSGVLSPSLTVSVELESSSGRDCVLRCVVDDGLGGGQGGWDIRDDVLFEWVAEDGHLEDSGHSVAKWTVPEDPGVYQVQVVVRKGTAGIAVGHINIKMDSF